MKKERKKKDLYSEMMAHSEHPWFILAPGLVSPFRAMHTREALIEDMQVTENFVCVKGVKTSTGHWTKDECEKKLDAYGDGFKFLPSPSRTIDRQHAAD